ncbi:MAG TPA: helix-turn-helix transcriptional regulator [Humibacter sp.]|jgi:DNA-binding XRE family transcriptional regulator|uniref:helix-turn-helix domain-containing protein n=1 Tax=Humibacter sp. RRB41 TaxID=2919946 RepID=UPI001FAAC4DA|nr:helix-turn-helix transcriptional regulator [Humibacter sp. RRB41]HWD63417.1 helix-turn-helix transcriptional regulator [Humibacter sp.]
MTVSLEQMAERLGISEEQRIADSERLRAEARAWRLRELRRAAGLTQAELAAVISVSQKRISQIERGDVEMLKVDTLRRYLRGIGLEPSLFITVDNQLAKIA